MVTNKHDTGFLALLLGGSGTFGAKWLHELWKADGCQFPLFKVVLDTDQANSHLKEEGIVDAIIPVHLDYDTIQTVKATPGRFGSSVPFIIDHVAAMLDPEELENGARTTRSLAQLLWEVCRGQIADDLNSCVRDFLRRTGCRRIIPFAATSSGGGTGSAFSILLAAALKDPHFRSRALQGFPDALLRKLNLVVVEPFFRAFANSGRPNQTSRILANAMAFRIESAFLENQGCFGKIGHLGLSGPSGGAVLDSEREVARVLGTTLYQYQKHWAERIKARSVDDPLGAHYLGEDTPEYFRPELPDPPREKSAKPTNGYDPNAGPPMSDGQVT